MFQAQEGGCTCGAVRYRVHNDPIRASVCHCKFCQHRTGSAFGIGVYFKQEDVEMLRGTLRVYTHRSDESQRWLAMEFCQNCGTTVTWTMELRPGARAIAGGTFDNPDWFKVDWHSWTRSAHRWVILPPEVAKYERSAVPAAPKTA